MGNRMIPDSGRLDLMKKGCPLTFPREMSNKIKNPFYSTFAPLEIQKTLKEQKRIY